MMNVKADKVFTKALPALGRVLSNPGSMMSYREPHLEDILS